jgi:hypothetical protein
MKSPSSINKTLAVIFRNRLSADLFSGVNLVKSQPIQIQCQLICTLLAIYPGCQRK